MSQLLNEKGLLEMSKADCAVGCFSSGFNCSQAVLSSFCEQLGLDRDLALKLSCSFGGGMGRMAETCGAVTGAFMLIGLKHGKCRIGDDESKEKTYALVRDFAERFMGLNGSIKCKELLNCDMSTPEGMRYAKENGLWDKLCTKFIRDSVAIIEDLLQ